MHNRSHNYFSNNQAKSKEINEGNIKMKQKKTKESTMKII